MKNIVEKINESLITEGKWFIHSFNTSKTVDFPVKEIDEQLLVINLDMRSIEFTSITGVKEEAAQWGTDLDTKYLEKLKIGESLQDGDLVFVKID